MLKAFLQSQVQALLICKSEALKDHLQKYTREYILGEAMGNSKSKFALSHDTVMQRLGIEPDHGTGALADDSDGDEPQVKPLVVPHTVSVTSISVGDDWIDC